MRYMRYTLLVLSCIGLSAWTLAHPLTNGDWISYMIAILKLDSAPSSFADWQRMHFEAYEAARSVCTDRQWYVLTESHPMRVHVASPETGPQLLSSGTPRNQFDSRILYNLPAYWLWKAGVPLGWAPNVVSSIFVGLCLWPIYVLCRAIGPWRSLLATVAMVFIWRMTYVGSYATPDSQMAFLCLLFLAYRDRAWSVAILILLPACRTNVILFALPAALIVSVRWRWRLATMMSSCAVYGLVTWHFMVPSWGTIFYHYMYGRTLNLPWLLYPQPGQSPPVTWAMYWQILSLRWPLIVNLGDRSMQGLVVYMLALLGVRWRDRQEWLALVVLPLWYWLSNFALYPDSYLRFFLWAWIAPTAFLLRRTET